MSTILMINNSGNSIDPFFQFTSNDNLYSYDNSVIENESDMTDHHQSAMYMEAEMVNTSHHNDSHSSQLFKCSNEGYYTEYSGSVQGK